MCEPASHASHASQGASHASHVSQGKIKNKKKVKKKMYWIRYIEPYYIFMSPSAIFDSFQTQFLSDRLVY